jgi:hypothetical protein
MTSRRPKPQFKLLPIDAFDARRGFRRCVPPGIRVDAGGPIAGADLWRHPDGRLFVRCSSQGYICSMECSLASGESVSDARLQECIDWLADVLIQWMVDGVDDFPEPFV